MRSLLFALVLSFAAPLSAQPENLSEHALKTFEIFKTIVEVDTSKAMGNTPKVARYLADELIATGFPEEDIEILRKGDLAALVARYRGDGSSGKKPILFLGHMDVVEACGRRGLGAAAVRADLGRNVFLCSRHHRQQVRRGPAHSANLK